MVSRKLLLLQDNYNQTEIIQVHEESSTVRHQASHPRLQPLPDSLQLVGLYGGLEVKAEDSNFTVFSLQLFQILHQR